MTETTSSMNTNSVPPTAEVSEPLAGEVANDAQSETIARLNNQLLEQSKQLAAYQAAQKQEEEKHREALFRNSEKVNAFLTGVQGMIVDETEREQLGDDLQKAQAFYESIPTMTIDKMTEFRPLMTVACKASSAYAKIDEMKKTYEEKNKALKRSLEEGEAMQQEISRLRRDNSELQQLSEERLRQNEQMVREVQDMTQRASKHDFSAPVSGSMSKQYKQNMLSMQQFMSKDKSAPSTTSLTGEPATNTPRSVADFDSVSNTTTTTNLSNMAKTTCAQEMSQQALGGLKTSILCASGSTSDRSRSGIKDMTDHVNHLSKFIQSCGVASTAIHYGVKGLATSSLSSASSSSMPSYSEADIVMAAMR